ncbi:MAG: hypothetical protein OK456_08405 [Thaumarchaeota archaeon]|nr:hypothetical protein [Nitrososphaerota archaeon]
MNARIRTLTSLSILLLLMLLSAFGVLDVGNAAAKADPPSLIPLTNGNADSILLPDSRFLVGYNTVRGPSLGALAAWTSFSNGTTDTGYVNLQSSVLTPKDVFGFAPGCLQSSTGCPSLDEGYIRTILNGTYPGNSASLNVINTLSGSAQLIPLHSPATPAGKCLTSNLTTVSWCNFFANSLYASGGDAVGVSPYPRVVGHGTPSVYSNEVVAWNGSGWTQLTPDDYQTVTTPCLDQSGGNITFGFDPTVIGDPLYVDSVGPQDFMPGDAGQVAYAMTDYHLDTPPGGCSLVQHETGVQVYVDGDPISGLNFAPVVGNATFNVQSCVAFRCFGGFVGLAGDLLIYSTYTDFLENSTYWALDMSQENGGNYQLPDQGDFGSSVGAYITDGERIAWAAPDASNPGNNVVWEFDPGSYAYASNGTVLHNVYPIGSFPGATPFGIDGNTTLWTFTNSTGIYLQAYELYDQSASKGLLLPAVYLEGPPANGAEVDAAVGSLPIYYDNGLAAWVGASGNATAPLSIYVYSVKAAEAAQPPLSSLNLGAYGFNDTNSVVASSLSEGWFFVNGFTTNDPVAQVYALNLTGLAATPTTTGTASSSTSETNSLVSNSTAQGSNSSSFSTSIQSQPSSSGTPQTTTTQTTTTGGGDLISGVPNLDLGIAVIIALAAIGVILYLGRFRARPPEGPPSVPPGGGEAAPSDGANGGKRDCTALKLAYDSALARYDEQAARFETVFEARVGGVLDSARADVAKAFTDMNYAWYEAEHAANAYAYCLGVPRSHVPIPDPPIFPGATEPTVHPDEDGGLSEKTEDETGKPEIG